MGYSTDFFGDFRLDRPLTAPHAEYLRAFSATRRMGRDVTVVATLPDPIREAAGLPVGPEGGYCLVAVPSPLLRGGDWQAARKAAGILDYNHPPKGQPGLWCQWVPNEDGTAIEWDGGEKFYDYVPWIAYLIEHFLQPWGYVLNGTVEWIGEDPDDRGRIAITNNRLRKQFGRVVYDEEDED